jgi:hypothetical protein
MDIANDSRTGTDHRASPDLYPLDHTGTCANMGTLTHRNITR